MLICPMLVGLDSQGKHLRTTQHVCKKRLEEKFIQSEKEREGNAKKQLTILCA